VDEMADGNGGQSGNRAPVAVLLSFFIPGLGHWYIHSPRALKYFGFYLVMVIADVLLWLVISIAAIMTNGMAALCLIIPIAINMVMVGYWLATILDTYYEAKGEEGKRLLQFLIK